MPTRLPPSLGAALRPVLPELTDAIIAAIGREVPDYARPLEGPFGRILRLGVQRALARFVYQIQNAQVDDPATREIYVALGRGEMRAGRSLNALLSAYRIGARLAWERFLAAGEQAGHEPATLYRLASAIFTYIDGISAESVEGYAQERAAAEGERQRRRRALVRLLARDDVQAEEIHDLVRLAEWPRPATVAALVVGDEPAATRAGGDDAAEEPDADRLASRLGGQAICAAEGGLIVAIVPDADAPGRRAQLEAALDGAPAALGPTVTLERARASLARARAAHALVREGRLDGRRFVVADEHLAALILHGGDATLGVDLAARALAPLEELRPAARARSLQTLRAWLDHPGQVQRVAQELHVHPQTVRYRLAALREVFGERLDDADARFELALALRAAPA